MHPEVGTDPDLVPFLGNRKIGFFLEDQDAVEEKRLAATCEVMSQAEPDDGLSGVCLDI